jgi:Zn finger protein HypA/HybF involved in hydrogenase expression
MGNNEHLQDPAFWEDVEAADLRIEIDRLALITNPSKGERNKLNRYKHQLEKVKQEAERLAALNKKWQTGASAKDQTTTRDQGTGVAFDEATTAAIFANAPIEKPKVPGKLYCSFCKDEVQSISATRGTGRVKVDRYTEPVMDGDKVVDIDEKVRVQAEKVIACPNCAHQVQKPQVASRV